MFDYSDDARKLAGIVCGYRPFRRSLGYFGWTGFENLGDEALYEAVKDSLFPVIVYNHPRFCKRGKFIQHALEDRLYSGMLLGAGTLINTVGYLAEVRRLQKRNKRVFVFGAGVLEPDFQEEVAGAVNCLDEWVHALRECEYVSVRGPHSRQVLETYGYQNAIVCGDPAVRFAKDKVEPKRGGRLVGINVGTVGKALWGRSDEKVSAFVTQLCRVLLARRYRIRLFSVWKDDQTCVEMIARELSGSVEVVNIHVSHDDYMEMLRDVDIFIGEKLHSVILALCTYTPSIMLAYAPKCEDFMASIDFMDYSIRTGRLDIEVILDMVDRIESDSQGYQQKLFTAMKDIKSRLDESANAIRKILLSN